MDINEFNMGIQYIPAKETKHLYHGSKNGIQGRIMPNFKQAREKTDFGQGFYLSDNPGQAKTLICGRDDYDPVFYTMDLNLNKLNCVQIRELPWALVIAQNRGYMENIKDAPLYEYVKHIYDGQDVIVGPIADDRMALVLDDFFKGTITDVALVACMEKLKLGTQYVAKTQRACDQISITATLPLGPEEITEMRKQSRQNRIDGHNLVEPIKRRYRRTGIYFDQILEEGGESFALGQHPVFHL